MVTQEMLKCQNQPHLIFTKKESLVDFAPLTVSFVKADDSLRVACLSVVL